jgi:hypothetical protein
MNKLTFLIFILLFVSCDQNRQVSNFKKTLINEKIEIWTDSIRKMVINEVDEYSIDSVSTDSDDHYINYFFFHKDKIVKAVGLTVDKKDTVAYYYKSIKTNYKANGENCPKHNSELIKAGGLHTYVGLKYNDRHIGTVTYLQCDKSTFEKGFYFEGEKIGKWKIFNKNLEIIDEKDYGKIDKLESFIENIDMKNEQ